MVTDPSRPFGKPHIPYLSSQGLGRGKQATEAWPTRVSYLLVIMIDLGGHKIQTRPMRVHFKMFVGTLGKESLSFH